MVASIISNTQMRIWVTWYADAAVYFQRKTGKNNSQHLVGGMIWSWQNLTQYDSQKLVPGDSYLRIDTQKPELRTNQKI